MGSGYLSSEDLKLAMAVAGLAQGDFAEIGVFRGALFSRLVTWAAMLQRHAHAFDSFIGMGSPGPHDNDLYPRGKFDVGGTAGFQRLMNAAKANPNFYSLWPGFVPDCFKGFDAPLAFAYLDLDHYEPTRISLPWVWDRLVPGGVLGIDDVVEGQRHSATLAVVEWINSNPPGLKVLWQRNDQLFIRRLHV